ncbi:MAG: DinB family protein, partial [Planctomycetota bacterium]
LKNQSLSPRHAVLLTKTPPGFNIVQTPESGVGRWPIRVLLGHLADTEMVFARRVRHIIAEQRPTLAMFDEMAYIDSGIYGCTDGTNLQPPIGGDVAMAHTTRSWLVALLMQLDGDQWQRVGMHPERGPITVRDVADYACWHLEHHASYLNAKVFKLLGPAPEPEACAPGGCSKPGCACG